MPARKRAGRGYSTRRDIGRHAIVIVYLIGSVAARKESIEDVCRRSGLCAQYAVVDLQEEFCLVGALADEIADAAHHEAFGSFDVDLYEASRLEFAGGNNLLKGGGFAAVALGEMLDLRQSSHDRGAPEIVT